MVNMKNITRGLETILKRNLTGYAIERNPERPEDPFKASTKEAWIGIYRGTLESAPHTTGDIWLANPTVTVEVQVASMKSQEDAEDRLCDAEVEVRRILRQPENKTIGGYVDTILSHTVEYQFNDTGNVYYHSALITIECEAREEL